MAIHYQTGKRDATSVWEIAGGMADLEWYRLPDDVKWFAALAELNENGPKWGRLSYAVEHALRAFYVSPGRRA